MKRFIAMLATVIIPGCAMAVIINLPSGNVVNYNQGTNTDNEIPNFGQVTNLIVIMAGTGGVDHVRYTDAEATNAALTAWPNLATNSTGDWTGTFDGQEGSYYLNFQNVTNKGDLVQAGIDTIAGATNTVVFPTVYAAVPDVVCGTGSNFNQLASIDVLAVSTNQFTYRVQGAGGLITNAFAVHWIASPASAGGSQQSGFVVRDDIASADFTEADLTMDNSWYTLSFTNIVPSYARVVQLSMQVKDNTASSSLVFKPLGYTNNIIRLAARTQVANIYVERHGLISMESGRSLQYKASQPLDNVFIWVTGWFR